jgi:putative CocE/NonD family hydrolase
VIGPWDHAGTRTPTDNVGGVKFGPNALLDVPKLHVDWYGWTMQGGPRPEFLKKQVAYYVTGADKWRYADSLDGVTGEMRPYVLQSTGGAANDVLASGAMIAAGSASGAPDRYVYDPRDVSLAAVEAKLEPGSMVDQTMVHAMRGRELVYHTAPFEKDVEVSGFFRFSAWIAIDQPDTDFAVEIDEILPDGAAIPLTHTMKRARYREDPRTPKLVSTRAPQLYEFSTFTFASRLVKKSSRLRLVFAPAVSINLEKNYNSGGVVAEESVKDARTVTVQLFHDKTHPSALYVPIAAAE